jgi:ferritin-like metal-binding protein YciE
MRIETMEELFIAQIQDLYDAEEQLVEALPKMAEASASPDLRSAFQEHLKQTKGHIQRLEQVFSEAGKKAGGETCEAMQGLIEEGEEIIDEMVESAVRDAGLIAAADRVEHYEMAGYGTARMIAEALGLTKSANLLQQTLDEEKKAADKLMRIAEEKILQEAMQVGGKTRAGKTRTAH